MSDWNLIELFGGSFLIFLVLRAMFHGHYQQGQELSVFAVLLALSLLVLTSVCFVSSVLMVIYVVHLTVPGGLLLIPYAVVMAIAVFTFLRVFVGVWIDYRNQIKTQYEENLPE